MREVRRDGLEVGHSYMARVSSKEEKACHPGKTDKEKTLTEPDKQCSFCTGLQAGSY